MPDRDASGFLVRMIHFLADRTRAQDVYTAKNR